MFCYNDQFYSIIEIIIDIILIIYIFIMEYHENV